MTTEALSKVHTVRPFQPFNILLRDGENLPVARAEMLAYTPKQRTALVYLEEGLFEIIDLSQVMRLEVPTRERGGGGRN